MLHFDKAKKILNSYGHGYTDEEVKILREFIAILVDIDYELFKRRLEEVYHETKFISLNTDHHEEKSHPIHPGEYRRAS